MQKELQDIGLSEKEARVYLAALKLGQATAERLAKEAKVNRSTTYVQIESLIKKGLMSTFEEGKKTLFAPESPVRLKRLFEMKRREQEAHEQKLEHILPELSRLFEGAGERPLVRFYSGKEGIASMREEALALPKGEEILVIYSYDSLFGLFSKEEADAFTRKRIERGIKVRHIYTRKAGKLPDAGKSPLLSRRFLPVEKMPLSSDFFIYRNNVAIMALKGPVFGVVIESKEIADSFRALFSVIWGLAA